MKHWKHWLVGDVVSIDRIKDLTIVGARHDARASVFSLLDNNGVRYRYCYPLKLYRIN